MFDLEPCPLAGSSMLACDPSRRLRLVQRTIDAMDMRANSEVSDVRSSEQNTGGVAALPSLASPPPPDILRAHATLWLSRGLHTKPNLLILCPNSTAL